MPSCQTSDGADNGSPRRIWGANNIQSLQPVRVSSSLLTAKTRRLIDQLVDSVSRAEIGVSVINQTDDLLLIMVTDQYILSVEFPMKNSAFMHVLARCQEISQRRLIEGGFASPEVLSESDHNTWTHHVPYVHRSEQF
jgi:hypothetical protein